MKMNKGPLNTYIDTLTGLYKGELFDTRLTEEIRRSNRTKIPFSLLAIEIDHYREYIKTLPETEEKRVLASVCRAIKQVTRDSDFCFLMAGGRINILLPYTDSFGAALVGEKICRQVEKIKWLQQRITISGAVVTYLRETRNPVQMLSLVDKRLSRAKSSDANKIYCDTSEVSLFNRLDFYCRKKYALIKFHKKQVLFDIVAILFIVSFVAYYMHARYQEREQWQLEYRENFQPENIETHWNINSGEWIIEDGELRTVPTEALSYVVTHEKSQTGNYRVKMEGHFERGAQVSDLSLIIGGEKDNPQKGYFIGIGSNENTRHKLLKLGEEKLVQVDEPLLHKTPYQVKVEKIDHYITVFLNGTPILEYWDLFPLNDIRHNKVSLYTFFPGMVVTSFEIYSQKEPKKVPLLNVPDTLFRLGHYEQAYHEYRELLPEYKDTDQYDVLTFKKALCLIQLQRLNDAEKLLQRVIYTGSVEGLIPYAKQQKAQILVERGQYGSALSSLKILLDEYRHDEQVKGLFASHLMSLAEILSVSHPRASNDFFHAYIHHVPRDTYGCAYAKIQMMENFIKSGDFHRFEETKSYFNEQFAYFRDFSFQRDRLSSWASFRKNQTQKAIQMIREMPARYEDLEYSFPQLYSQEARYYFYIEDYENLQRLYEKTTRQEYRDQENHDLLLVESLWSLSRELEGDDEGMQTLEERLSQMSDQSIYQMYPRLYKGYIHYLREEYYLARQSFYRVSQAALKQPEGLRNAQIMTGLSFLAEGNPFALKTWGDEVMQNRPSYSLEYLVARYLLDEVTASEFIGIFTSEKKRLFPLAYYITAEKALFEGQKDLAEEYYTDSLYYSQWNEFPSYLVERRKTSHF